MPPAIDIGGLSPVEIIAKTAWAEARSLGVRGMTATINTGQNRLSSGITWWGKTLDQIFTHPWQYSCWNNNDPNLSKLLAVTTEDPQYLSALDLANQAEQGTLQDITGGATHYFNKKVVSPPWAVGKIPCFVIDPQVYYRII